MALGAWWIDLDHLGLRKMTTREQLREARAAAYKSQKGNAGEQLRDVFLCGVDPVAGTVFSFYFPFKDEIDTLPLARALSERGYALSLPCIEEGREDLIFRSYRFGDPLRSGVNFGIQEPLPEAPLVFPHVLLMPVVGFDQQGNRIGLGGGYYDKTLALMRASGQVRCAIGLAFSAQEADCLPAAPYDQKLDLIVTEREVIDPSFSIEF